MDMEEKFLAVGEACVVIGRPTPGFKGQTFPSSEFPREGTVICMSTVPYRRCANMTTGWPKCVLNYGFRICFYESYEPHLIESNPFPQGLAVTLTTASHISVLCSLELKDPPKKCAM